MARILIVEPHPDVSSLLELVVTRLGHEPVVYGARERELLDIAAAVIEPGQAQGLSVARRLRERNVPVVFISIFPAEGEALELGPAAYLVKPFALYSLEQALTIALQRVPRRIGTASRATAAV